MELKIEHSKELSHQHFLLAGRIHTYENKMKLRLRFIICKNIIFGVYFSIKNKIKMKFETAFITIINGISFGV